MPSYKPYNYAQAMMVPVDLEEQLLSGTLEFAIHILIDTRINMDIFDKNYNNDETGSPAYDPKLLLKIILYGYANAIISSRKLEKACRSNIIFMTLACGKTPDHSTIASFISSMQDEILLIFQEILLVCEEENLLGGTSFALDGLKLPSNASKQWSGTFDELKSKKEKFENKLKELMIEDQRTDKKEDEDKNRSEIEKRQRKIKRLRAKAERIQKWLEENEPKKGKDREELKSNITDNDSCKMVTSHGTIQGYNGQALVDSNHQVIVHAKASGKGQDFDHVAAMVDGAKDNVKAIGFSEDYFEGKELTADSNYHSMTNLKKCKEEKLDAYIPDVNFRKRDPRFSGQGKYKQQKTNRKFTLDDFKYDKENDRYICPAGEILELRARGAKIEYNKYRRYVAPKDVCPTCRFRKRCLKTKTTKRKHLAINLGKEPENLIRQMIEKIDTEWGKRIYEKRIAIVEPVFANIRTHKRLDRFTLRGETKVNIQWMLYCIVHNIEKIVNFGVSYA